MVASLRHFFARASRPYRRGAPAIALALGLGLGAGCFIETEPPPTFRYRCDDASDCRDGEACDDGLCQFTCTVETFSEDCPNEDGFATCFNGHCTHVCQISEDRCTSPQRCLSLPVAVVEPDPTTPPASDFGFCGIPCEEGGCPDGQTCIESVCLATCDEMDTDPLACGATATCVGGICIPDEAFSG